MKTYVFKLYRNSRKERHLHCLINTAANIYNYCISLHKRYYRRYGKHLNTNRLSKQVTKRKRKYTFWKKLNSQAIQDVRERIDRGFKLFFKQYKQGTRPPSFRKTRKYKSITFKQTGYKLDSVNGVVEIQKVKFKYHKSQEVKGKVKTLTVKRNNLGEFFLIIVTDYTEEKDFKRESGKIAGFDFGLKTFLTCSDGASFESPEFYKRNSKALAHKNRQLSRKKKSSSNRKRCLYSLARHHKKTKNQREDHHWKLARELCQSFDVLVFEDLNIKGMKKLWGKKISDLGFYSFLQKLEWMAKKLGKKVIKIDRYFPSSRLCSHCGHKNTSLQLKDREWECPSCGTQHKRDLNAAINIEREGASSLDLEDVRLALASCLV